MEFADTRFMPWGMRLLALLAVFGSLIAGGSGCGRVGNNEEVRLGVPYRQQDTTFNCGPASILMWRLYDGLPEISQQTIGNWIGTSSCSGSSPQEITNGVNHFTATSDAFWDLAGDVEYEEFFARQITSLDNSTPVIALIEGGLHAGVVDGGRWHENSAGNYQWDYVYFHDPFLGAGLYYGAGEWMDTSCPSGGTCGQIVSSSAIGAFNYNLATYRDRVRVMGGGNRGPLHQD